ncbi:MAG TPA: IS200/IS605 family transposase [Gemmata sp.]|jgi:putative transposase|nr:IS200/IS605 family transposase [Gemmata sp.]
MPQSLARNVVHLVYSTKNREPFIVASLRDRLFAYLAGTLNELGCPAISVGGVADHVHLLFVLSKTVALSKAVEEVKKSSSKWMKENGEPRFYWQNGYGAFSVSASNEEKVTAYIANQEVHHRTKSFQDEFREFLKKHRIEWDEQYVWD